jgi:hypothetical protein
VRSVISAQKNRLLDILILYAGTKEGISVQVGSTVFSTLLISGESVMINRQYLYPIFIFLCSISIISAATLDLSKPTVYGMVNVEQRYIDQDALNYTKTAAGGFTVENLPSRLGLYGLAHSEDLSGITIGYFLEMGFAPRQATGDIKLRIAALTLQHSWGRLKMGQAYTATALAARELDPLWNTGAALVGYDQAYDMQGTHNFAGLGYSSRWYKDVIEYRTPKWKGLQLAISADRDDDPRLKRTTTTATSAVHWDTANFPATYYEALLSYNFKGANSYHSKTILGWVKGNGPSYSFEMTDTLGLIYGEQRYFIGTYQHFKQFSLGLFYSQVEQGDSDSDKTHEAKRYMATLSYQQEKNRYSLTYGKFHFDSNLTGTNSDEKEACQLAIGYQRELHKIAKFTLTAFQYEARHSNPALTSSSNNSAQAVMAGVAITF